ncbi:MAG: ABC transporter substrate-binding protein [Synergistaceae bacterium]|jgi:iron complex transport system substrate-binding protein|nr:ABC transporter substrate-binding protein [Synergistaceae bacterium]
MKQTVKKFMVSAAFFVAFLIFLMGRSVWAAVPDRILSITPAGTEILYDLGLGGRVIGVTKYCSWPPEAQTKPSLGDMMHVNLEVVMGMTPDLVLVSNMNVQVGEQVGALGYPVVTVYQDDFEQICDSMLRVGQACGVEEMAKRRIAELRESVRAKTIPLSETPPKVLIVVGRDPSEEDVRKIYVAGQVAFYNDLIARAGGVNAYAQDVPYAQMSREGLLRVDPDVIIELIGESGMEATMEIPTDHVISQWKAVPDLRAAREGRVAVIRGDFTLRAGPRYPQILDAFITIIRDGVREISQ